MATVQGFFFRMVQLPLLLTKVASVNKKGQYLKHYRHPCVDIDSKTSQDNITVLSPEWWKEFHLLIDQFIKGFC